MFAAHHTSSGLRAVELDGIWRVNSVLPRSSPHVSCSVAKRWVLKKNNPLAATSSAMTRGGGIGTPYQINKWPRAIGRRKIPELDRISAGIHGRSPDENPLIELSICNTATYEPQNPYNSDRLQLTQVHLKAPNE